MWKEMKILSIVEYSRATRNRCRKRITRLHTDPKLLALIKILVQPTNVERNENSINLRIQQSNKKQMQKKNDKATHRLQIVSPDQNQFSQPLWKEMKILSIVEYSRELRRAVEVSVNGKEFIYIYFVHFVFHISY